MSLTFVPRVSLRPIRAFATTIAQEGIVVDSLLERAGIDRLTYGDPNATVAYPSACLFYEAALESTSNPALGLAAARNYDAAQLHLLEYFIASSTDVRQALDSLVQNITLFGDGKFFSVETHNEGVLLRFDPLSPATPRCLVEFVVGSLFLVGRRVAGRRATPGGSHAWFAFPKPDYVAECRSFFDGCVTFDAPAHGLLLSPNKLPLKMERANPQLRKLLEPQLHAMALQRGQGGSVSDRVRTLIAAALPEGDVSMDAVARKLHMSRSTLRRKLVCEGASHRGLLQAVRAALAIEHLRQGDRSVAEVAFLVGYDDVSAFHKAFKQWTGYTPAEHQARFRSTHHRAEGA